MASAFEHEDGERARRLRGFSASQGVVRTQGLVASPTSGDGIEVVNHPDILLGRYLRAGHPLPVV
jgi:hypothetical protein